MTPMSLGLFVKKLQSQVGLGGYEILFAYFVVEAKSKIRKNGSRDLGDTPMIAFYWLEVSPKGYPEGIKYK